MKCQLDGTQTGIKILGEISITSDIQMTPPLSEIAKSTNIKTQDFQKTQPGVFK